MLYIDATVEDFEHICNRCNIECFSRPAMAAIIDWYDTNDVDQELDCSDLGGQWYEYTSAAEMWYDYAHLDKGLPHLYDPEQTDDLVAAIEAKIGDVIQTEAGWLVHRA